MTSRKFCKLIHEERITFCTGVPDSTLADLFREIEKDKRFDYVPSVREDLAIGLATGAFFANRRSLVLMQNSGLGYCLNALASLPLLYHVPMLLVIGWRGYGNHDSPEHTIFGKSTTALLKAVGIPYLVLGSKKEEEKINLLIKQMHANHMPVALLVRDGILKNETK